MKDFKQNTKMSATGSHYCGGGKVKKYAEGGSTYQARTEEDMAKGREILEGKRPKQATPGKMETYERRASIAKAVGAPSKEYSLANAEVNKKRSGRGADAEELQKLLGSDVKVGYKRGGKVKRGCK
jgi:hypothetical protein